MSTICPNCKKTVADGTKFCLFCGSRIPSGAAYSAAGFNQQQRAQYSGGSNTYRTASSASGTPVPPELSEQVVDSNERLIALLSDSVAKTFVTGGGIGKNQIFFTNKNFYAKTNRFTLRKGIVTSNFIVDLQSISGSSILHKNPVVILFFAITFLLSAFIGLLAQEPASAGACIVLTIILGIWYFLRKGTYLRVSFPGESRELSVKMYNYETVMAFHKKLRSVINR